MIISIELGSSVILLLRKTFLSDCPCASRRKNSYASPLTPGRASRTFLTVILAASPGFLFLKRSFKLLRKAGIKLLVQRVGCKMTILYSPPYYLPWAWKGLETSGYCSAKISTAEGLKLSTMQASADATAVCGGKHCPCSTCDSSKSSRRGMYHQHNKSQAVLLSHVFADSLSHVIGF